MTPAGSQSRQSRPGRGEADLIEFVVHGHVFTPVTHRGDDHREATTTQCAIEGDAQRLFLDAATATVQQRRRVGIHERGEPALEWLATNPSGADLVVLDVMLPGIDGFTVAAELRKLYGYLVDRGCLVYLDNFTREYLPIFSRDVLDKIAANDRTWETMVPEKVARIIREHRLLGCKG